MTNPSYSAKQMSALSAMFSSDPGDPDDWKQRGACRDVPQWWFFEDNDPNASKAKAVCADCPVRGKCLQAAMDGHEQFGVWGGMLPRERATYRRKLLRAGKIEPRRRASIKVDVSEIPDAIEDGPNNDATYNGNADHGTTSRYTSGCRCRECRYACRLYQRGRRRRPA